MGSSYLSIRMHASRSGVHLTGAEDLVPPSAIDDCARLLLQRALQHHPDSLKLSVDPVSTDEMVTGTLPDLHLAQVEDVATARQRAMAALIGAGVTQRAAATALQALSAGAAPGGRVMRGAMLIDAHTGERCEPDRTRGVRVSHFGWDAKARNDCRELLRHHGLDHFRTFEALAIAAKVLAADGILAELCWSDDPDYTTGYVASRHGGYLRLPYLKEAGDPLGGRAFFFSPGTDLQTLIAFLEQTPFLISAVGGACPEIS